MKRQKRQSRNFSFFESRPKKEAKKRAKIFCLRDEKTTATDTEHERRKGFGLFFIKSTCKKKRLFCVSSDTHTHTHNIFSTQNGFFCQPRDDDDEHRGEEHFE